MFPPSSLFLPALKQNGLYSSRLRQAVEKVLLEEKKPIKVYSYCLYVLGGPWPGAESIICQDFLTASAYALGILKLRGRAHVDWVNAHGFRWGESMKLTSQKDT